MKHANTGKHARIYTLTRIHMYAPTSVRKLCVQLKPPAWTCILTLNVSAAHSWLPFASAYSLNLTALHLYAHTGQP